jgi:hypothetical protein
MRRASGSRFLALLDTFEHVTDEEQRTAQALRFMPWVFALFIAICVAALVGVDMTVAHAHAAQIAKSAVVRWSGAVVMGGTGVAATVVKLRRVVRRQNGRAPRGSGESRSSCTRQTRQGPHRRCVHPVSAPPRGARHGD